MTPVQMNFGEFEGGFWTCHDLEHHMIVPMMRRILLQSHLTGFAWKFMDMPRPRLGVGAA